MLIMFNQPVKKAKIISHYNSCICDIHHTITNDSKGLRFSYGCGAMGGEYPFSISVESENGEQLNKKNQCRLL